MIILRGIAGLLLGSGYGLIVGAVAFLLVRLTSDPATPGPMIPDNNAWGEIVVMFSTIIAGGCGAVVGLVVGLIGVGKVRAGMIGAAVGLVVFLCYFRNEWTDFKLSFLLSPEFWVVLIFPLLLLPVGLGLTGIAVSIILGKAKRG